MRICRAVHINVHRFHSLCRQKISCIRLDITGLVVILRVSSKSRKSRNGWADRKKQDIREYRRKRECARKTGKRSVGERSKRSWTNRRGEAAKREYIRYPRHYGARSSFLIEIPSYFQPARVTRAPNPRFDAISLSLRSKCEKWNIFIGLDASVAHTASTERYNELIRARDIFLCT